MMTSDYLLAHQEPEVRPHFAHAEFLHGARRGRRQYKRPPVIRAPGDL